MAEPRLAVYYWTGTGNTARAVGVVARELTSAGWEVGTTQVRHDTPFPALPELAGTTLILLACPTLGFSAPAGFLSWLRGWPEVKAHPGAAPSVALLAVCGAEQGKGRVIPGHSGGLRRQLARRLTAKGLPMLAVADVSYPANWSQVMPPPSAAAVANLVTRGDAEVEAFARALVAGTPLPDRRSRWVSAPLAAVGVLFRWFARRFLVRLYAADAACTSCGLCAAQCPVGAIRLSAGPALPRLPRWSSRCDACNRCINLCPEAAIQTSWFRLGVHGGFQLAVTVAALAALGPLGPVVPALLWAALTAFELTWLEAAVGWFERRPGLRKRLTRGPSQRWGRYWAPGFVPRASETPEGSSRSLV